MTDTPSGFRATIWKTSSTARTFGEEALKFRAPFPLSNRLVIIGSKASETPRALDPARPCAKLLKPSNDKMVHWRYVYLKIL